MADRCPLPPWLILHIPHASRYIPNEVRQALCVDAAEFELEQDRLVDHHTDKLFHLRSTLVARCKAKVSPFAVDVERYEEDEHEPMSSIGMGAIYTHTTDGSLLRTPPTAAQRQQLLDAYYRLRDPDVCREIVDRPTLRARSAAAMPPDKTIV